MLRLSRAKTLIAAAAVAALAVPAVPAASAATDEYGAIAWSPVKHTVGYALGSSQAAAEAAAVKDCERKGGSTNCVGFVWFQHAWGALATSSNGHVGWGWGWDTTSSDKARTAAGNYAVQGCVQGGGRNCRVVKDLDTSGVPGRGTGGAGPYWTKVGAGWQPNWHYVAAGDSYSAGKGNPPDNSADCGRSSKAYGPQLLAAVPTLGKLGFIACSGAVTDDFYSFKPRFPQKAAVALLPNVLSLTLTISGNDLGFEKIVKACINKSDCRKGQQSEFDSRLTALAGRGKATTPGGRPIHPVTTLLKDLSGVAPKAQIFLGGYPRLFGDKIAKYTKSKHGTYCPIGLTRQVSYDEAQWINKQIDRTNKVLSDAVNAAKKAKVRATFVPVSTAYISHGLCDTGTPWILPLQTDWRLDTSASLHPNLAGQTAYMKSFRAKEGL